MWHENEFNKQSAQMWHDSTCYDTYFEYTNFFFGNSYIDNDRKYWNTYKEWTVKFAAWSWQNGVPVKELPDKSLHKRKQNDYILLIV